MRFGPLGIAQQPGQDLHRQRADVVIGLDPEGAVAGQRLGSRDAVGVAVEHARGLVGTAVQSA